LAPVLEEFLSDPAADVSALHDVARIKAILEQCGRDGRAISYSELLLNLGFRFTRPKMRAVCKTLDKIDQITAEEGAPALAVLVVREGTAYRGRDGGQGELIIKVNGQGRKRMPISARCRMMCSHIGKTNRFEFETHLGSRN
jgi:hypothetical protein